MVVTHHGADRAGQRQHRATARAAACLLYMLACIYAAEAALVNQRPGNVLTMILTGCSEYQDWQTIAAAFAWRQSGQPGSVIRVANCDEKDMKNYDPRMLDYVATHIAKQVSIVKSCACGGV